MEWSPQQAAALDKVQAWLDNPDAEQVFKLFGYAGTGKSTLAQEIAKMDSAGYVQFASFTGKAAVVMRRKGCENARTLHGLIYRSHEKAKTELMRLEALLETAKAHSQPIGDITRAIEAEKDNVRQPGFTKKPDALQLWEGSFEDGDRRPTHRIDTFCIDECSMVDERLGGDLLSFGAKTLVLGDPAQLPPVMGGGFFTNGKPDVLLTEIHRQAADNPIIQMASRIRQGDNLDLGEYGESRVAYTSELSPGTWLQADQILCGKNITRQQINGRVRQLRGFEGYLPCPGEKLVCLRNSREEELLNGSLWECLESIDAPDGDTFRVRLKSLDAVAGEEREMTTLVHKANFMGVKLDDYFDRLRANEFDFGYALTVHKAQGSQWDNVVIMDEWNRQDSRQQWLYTAVTRAAERVTVARRGG